MRLGTDGLELLEGARCLVKSPGVPAEAPVVAAARERGATVVGELELAWRLLANRFVAVTGTNGKTTVTELLGHMWRTAGEPVAVAGNVGTPLASLVGELDADATVVCECSSFQLEDTEAFAPECAVLLNASPDHLDRHRDFDEYLRAKLRIFANQGNDDAAIFNASEAVLRGLDLGGCGRRIAYCRGVDPDCEVAVADGVIFAAGEPLLPADELGCSGRTTPRTRWRRQPRRSRWAWTGTRFATGSEPSAASPTGSSGWPSSAASSTSTTRRPRTSPRRPRRCAPSRAGCGRSWAASLKGGDFAALLDPVVERCRACYLIGDAAEQLAAELGPPRSTGWSSADARTSPTR